MHSELAVVKIFEWKIIALLSDRNRLFSRPNHVNEIVFTRTEVLIAPVLSIFEFIYGTVITVDASDHS